VDIALIVEPGVYKRQVRGLTKFGGTLYTVALGLKSRSCSYNRNHINALSLLEFCSRDATMVRITYTSGGGKELVVSSAYLPYNSDEPTPSKEVKDIIDYCHSRKKQLITGCDANAQHTLWGSTGVNPRRESLMQYLVSSNLYILNCGNEPTFVVSNRKEVIDLTLGTNEIANLVSNCHVSDEVSLSDHRYISFELGNISIAGYLQESKKNQLGVIRRRPNGQSGNLTAKNAHDKGHRWVH
jgi:hypothetical protein